MNDAVRVVIVGFFGGPNLGDEAFLSVLLECIQSCGVETSVTVVSTNPKQTAERTAVEVVPRSPFSVQAWNALIKADVVVAAGGGLLTDRTSIWQVPATALPCLLAAASGADVFLVGMGAPTIETYFARTLVRRLLRRARWITARDDMSFKALQELASDAEGRVIRGADTALALSRSGAVDRDRMRTDGDHVRIGLMLRDWIPRHRERGLAHLLPVALRRRILRFRDPTAAERLFWADLAGACRDLLSMDEAIELCFLPMWPGRDDLRARRFVADHLSEVDSDRICIWRPTDDPIQMLHSIQSLDCVISMRLHALIFAALSGVPAVALSCAVKQDEFMRQIEGSDRIFSVYDFEADRFVAGVSEVVADGALVAARQSENLGAMANIALRDLTRLQFEIRLRTESAGVAAFGQ